MPDLDRFEAEVKEHMRQLSAKDAATRRKAAQWLGEAGDPTAITVLAQAYKNDTDPGVRSAAAYSLGMFRKLEQELNGPHADTVVELLQDVADGHMGGSPAIPVRTLKKVMIALLLSALAVGALAFVLPPMLRGSGAGTSPTIDETPPPASNSSVEDKDRATLLTELRGAYNAINSNVNKLRGQYQSVLGGGTLGCNEFFDGMTPVALSANNTRDFADLAAVAARVNQAQTDFTAAKSTYDQVCDGGETLNAGAFGAPMAQVVTLITSLADTDAALIAAEGQTGDAPAPTEAVPTTVVETPTAEVVATSAPAADARPHVAALQGIIDDVTAARGAHSLLNQYWNEGKTTGATFGCQETPPTIPANYTLPDELASNQTLKLSADLVNTGLQALRDGWGEFAAACAGGTLGPTADAGLLRASGAKTAFDTAATQLAGLRG